MKFKKYINIYKEVMDNNNIGLLFSRQITT